MKGKRKFFINFFQEAAKRRFLTFNYKRDSLEYRYFLPDPTN